MNDREKLIQRESNRYKLLKYVYDESEATTISFIKIYEIEKYLTAQEEISEEEAGHTLRYLEDKRLIERRDNQHISITHSGVREVEDSIKYPERSTTHFSTQAIQFNIREVVMGDKFENVSDSIIVNRSEVDNSFNSSTSEQVKTLDEAVNEIQKILELLEKNNPTATDIEKVTYVNIVTNPNLKRRAIAALKAGGDKAIDELISENKFMKVMKSTFRGWMKAE